jgi:hypothetical protein
MTREDASGRGMVSGLGRIEELTLNHNALRVPWRKASSGRATALACSMAGEAICPGRGRREAARAAACRPCKARCALANADRGLAAHGVVRDLQQEIYSTDLRRQHRAHRPERQTPFFYNP